MSDGLINIYSVYLSILILLPLYYIILIKRYRSYLICAYGNFNNFIIIPLYRATLPTMGRIEPAKRAKLTTTAGINIGIH